MTRKEQNKILDAKIESNVNQYKVDRLNAEISAFSSGDLNKYEFLKRIDLNYKPNALDKADGDMSGGPRPFLTPPALDLKAWPIQPQAWAGGVKKGWGLPDISASTYFLISNLIPGAGCFAARPLH